MLTLKKQPQYIQKTIVLPNGAKALVVFELVETNGKVKAKAVFWKALEQTVSQKEEIIALPVYFERNLVEPIVSPFFSEVKEILKNLSFITAQPTRAPNFS